MCTVLSTIAGKRLNSVSKYLNCPIKQNLFLSHTLPFKASRDTLTQGEDLLEIPVINLLAQPLDMSGFAIYLHFTCM
jgi:hypothetical protein